MDLGSLLNNTLIKNEEVNLASGKIGDDTTEKDNEIEADNVGTDNGEDEEEGIPPSMSTLDSVYDEIEDIVKENPNKRFMKPWNKLEKGMKLNRIIQFVETETDEKELSIDQSKELKNILFRACDSGLLNKLTEVNYNEEEACIISFKSLEFNEETNKYKIKTVSSKHRPNTKSKSNIDRLLKSKKK